MNTKKLYLIVLRILPYVCALLFGLGLFGLSSFLRDDWKSIVLGAAGSFFAIPTLYLGYECIKSLTNKRLNQEIFEYAKMQVDSNMLSILAQLQKIIYSNDHLDKTLEGLSNCLKLDKKKIGELLSKNEVLGFSALKHWEVPEQVFHDLLKNTFVCQRLSKDQVISIITNLKALRGFSSFLNSSDLYICTDKKVEGYSIVKGQDINPQNSKYPERYILLRKIGDDKGIVVDFGDFKGDKVNALLNIWRVNEKYIVAYAEFIFDILQEINTWVMQTGCEFLMDSRQFRFGKKSHINETKI